MATSSQLTRYCSTQPNAAESEWELWVKTRYLVAQVPTSEDFTETTDGYYLGRVVVPGPLADPEFSTIANVNDFTYIRNQLYIRFIDSNTTTGADAHIGQALFTIMTKDEADAYESALRTQYFKNK